jgi:Ca2+-binding EF-hand superfamily protein
MSRAPYFRKSSPLKRSLLFLPVAALLSGCAGTGANFQQMDLDHDGFVSRGEFTDAVAAITFARADRNQDGVIDLEEWRAVEGPSGDALFRLRDLSRNGKISPQEARLAAEKNGSLAAVFTAIDSNRDGVIDRAEAARYASAHR